MKIISAVMERGRAFRSRRNARNHVLPVLISRLQDCSMHIRHAFNGSIQSRGAEDFSDSARLPIDVEHVLSRTLEQFGLDNDECNVPVDSSRSVKIVRTAWYSADEQLSKWLKKHNYADLLETMAFLSFQHQLLTAVEDAVVENDAMPDVLLKIISVRNSIQSNAAMFKGSVKTFVSSARKRNILPDLSSTISEVLVMSSEMGERTARELAETIWEIVRQDIKQALMGSYGEDVCASDELLQEYGFMVFRSTCLLHVERYLWGNVNESEFASLVAELNDRSPVSIN